MGWKSWISMPTVIHDAGAYIDQVADRETNTGNKGGAENSEPTVLATIKTPDTGACIFLPYGYGAQLKPYQDDASPLPINYGYHQHKLRRSNSKGRLHGDRRRTRRMKSGNPPALIITHPSKTLAHS